MVVTGILDKDSHVELLESQIVTNLPRGPRHEATKTIMMYVFATFIPKHWSLRITASLQLPDSQPEPDLSIVRTRNNAYLHAHPRAEDVALVVEVADASLLRDQRDKARIYARAGIAIYWVVNLIDHRIEVYTQPSGPTDSPTYGIVTLYQPSDKIPLELAGQTIARILVAQLLP